MAGELETRYKTLRKKEDPKTKMKYTITNTMTQICLVRKNT